MSTLTTVKKVENAVLMKDARGELFIRIDRVRLSYPFLGKPSKDKDEETGVERRSWRVQAMLPKATHLAAKNLCKEVITKLMTDNEAKVPSANWFIKDGDEAEGEEMAGHWLISASANAEKLTNAPKIRNRKGEQMERTEEGTLEIDKMFYGGCWGSVLIRPWYFGGQAKGKSKTFPKRVPANLTGVLFWKDDKPFGAGSVDESDAWELPPDDEGGDGSAMGGGDGLDDDDI